MVIRFFLVLCLDFFLIGVGTSAIGLLSFLNQFAQSRPVVYIPYGGTWVASCFDSTNSPVTAKARNYFMHEFFLQNADLIAATPSLFTLFRCFFDGTPPSDDLYVDFATALEAGTIPQCGFIVDESQVNFWFNAVIVGCVLLFCQFVCVV